MEWFWIFAGACVFSRITAKAAHVHQPVPCLPGYQGVYAAEKTECRAMSSFMGRLKRSTTECEAGYTFDENTNECVDLDECQLDPPVCEVFGDKRLQCVNIPGRYVCVYSYIDECQQSPPVCGSSMICSNAPGRYWCMCGLKVLRDRTNDGDRNRLVTLLFHLSKGYGFNFGSVPSVTSGVSTMIKQMF